MIKSFLNKKVDFSTEIIAGITTFLTMSYILFVNADILSKAGMDKTTMIVITGLVTGLITIITGIFTNSPIAMAPGMGLNAYFAFSLVLGMKIKWEIALGMVFISGLFFLILSVVGIRRKLVEAIPSDILSAISVGIGIFISFIGLQNLGLIVNNDATLVSIGKLSPTVLIGLAGLLLIIILEIKKIKGGLLLGIVFSTILAIIFGFVSLPKNIISLNFSISKIAFKIDIGSALKLSLFAPIFSLMFIDMFDSIGSILGLTSEMDIKNKDERSGLIQRLLNIDAIATMIGALFGTSTTTTYIESAAGIEEGGKSGLTSIITGLMFFLSLFFLPLISIVPSYATAPALIMVGFYMLKNISRIDFYKPEIGFPSFMIIIMIALSYSISTGLAFGFLSYTFLKIVKGEIKDIKITLWIINALCILFFII